MPTCPSCNHDAPYVGFSKVECSNPECTHYVPTVKKDNNSEVTVAELAFVEKVIRDIVSCTEWLAWSMAPNARVIPTRDTCFNLIKHVIKNKHWRSVSENPVTHCVTPQPRVLMRGKTRVIHFSNADEVYLEIEIDDITNGIPLLTRRAWKIPEEIC